jgi:S-adenosylmethionine:diacylglycerol 3-amino-3-carboxypropyl transferase/ubiquinone/menaquinone biosynthesis C-methylase UbiE
MEDLDLSDYIYAVSAEDPECDFKEYKIKDCSRIAMITTGGDNVLVYLTKNVECIYTFDLNPYQNHLLEMKIAIILSCELDEATSIIGQNDYDLFIKKYQKIRKHLRTNEAKQYWDIPKNQMKFKTFQNQNYSGVIDTQFITINVLKYVDVISSPEFDSINKHIIKYTSSYQGIPSRQYEMYGGFDKNACDFVRKMLNYNILNNTVKEYYWKGILNGKWDKSTLPLYLHEEWYYVVRSRLNRVTIITGTIIDSMKDNHPSNFFTHINLLDSMDWMPDNVVAKQIKELRKYSTQDTKICFRSAYHRQPFACLLNQYITSKDVWVDPTAYLDRVGSYNTIHVMKYNDSYPIHLVQNVEYKPNMLKDCKTLLQMIVPKHIDTNISTNNSGFLDAFYKEQAEYYDNYRSRMLWGKEKLMNMIPYFVGMKILLFAGGTGDISKYIPNIQHKITCMDLCSPLLDVAKSRYPHMKTIKADAEKFISKTQMDFVICSYSLTMIPNWKSAIECMVKSCKVNGYICCCDFTIYGDNILQNTIVKNTFAQDNVLLNPEHIRYLTNHQQLELCRVCLDEGGFPLIPQIYKATYYYGIWKKIK